MHTYIHTRINTHTHTHAYTHVHTYTRIHIYTNTHSRLPYVAVGSDHAGNSAVDTR
jgi:hypothetical protein